MVQRPEKTEYVQRLKEYRQRQNRKYKQRRKRVLYRKRNSRKTNTIQNTGSIFFFFFPLIIFCKGPPTNHIIIIITFTSFSNTSCLSYYVEIVVRSGLSLPRLLGANFLSEHIPSQFAFSILCAVGFSSSFEFSRSDF